MARTSLCTASLLLLVICGNSGAQSVALQEIRSPGVYFQGEDPESYLPAPVLGSFVQLQVSGLVARGTVTQIFYNPTDEWLEAVYLFPLPEDAAVDRLAMTVGERVLEGRIAEHAEAEETYREARQEGVKAVLVEQLRPDLFTASVANVGPGEEVEVEIELQFAARYDGDRFRLRFPMLAAERYRPRDAAPGAGERPLPAVPRLTAGAAAASPVALRVELAAGFPIHEVSSPTHAVRLAERSATACAVELADGVAAADGDFVLEWTPRPGEAPRASLSVEEADGELYALLMVLPPVTTDAVRLPREAIFVVDTSGSMEGASLRQAKRALRLALDDLLPGDRFNVIRFSDAPELFAPAAVAADPEAVAVARGWVAALEVNGGTVMLPALDAALSGAEHSAAVRQVVFITDGQADNEAELFAHIRRHLGASRLFTVGIGSAPNGHFMRRAARFGRGTYTFISGPEEVESRMTALLAKLAAPVMSDLEVLWDDPGAEVWPERLGDLYLGEPLVIAARLPRPRGEVRLSGLRAGQRWETSLPLAGAARGAGIGRLWARHKVTALMDRLVDGAAEEEVRPEVVALALRHRMVTAYTSLVAVDVSPSAPPGVEPVVRPVPLAAPRGAGQQVMSFDVAYYGGGVEENILVTSEAPLLDSTSASLSTLVEPYDLPTARHPWSALARAPGVLTDRVDVGGARPGPPSFVGGGAAATDNAVRLDGVETTGELSGEPAFPLGSPGLVAVAVTTAGGAAGRGEPGVGVDLSTRSGSNRWHGSGHLVWADPSASGAGAATGDRLQRLGEAELDLGGPLVTDRLWLWGGFAASGSDSLAPGGQPRGSELEHAAAKLDWQPSQNTAATVAFHRGDRATDGRGAGFDRARAATWDHRGRAEQGRLEATHVISATAFVSAGWSELEQRQSDLPRGGLDTPAFTDAQGVARGSSFGRTGEQRRRSLHLDGTLFASLGSSDHELRLGARQHRFSGTTGWLAGHGLAVEAGSNLGLGGGTAVAARWHDTAARADVERRAVWLQDEISLGRLTLHLGLRLDTQEMTHRVETSGQGESATASSRDLSPRLALAWTLGDTLLRATYGRFVSRLGPIAAARLAEGFPAADFHLFTDTGGDLAADPGERAWFGVRPDLLAPDLEPEASDEAVLSIERLVGWRTKVGLSAVHRRRGGVLERRTLVRDAAGAVFAARAGDWLEIGALTGTLPGGDPYRAPVFDLRPGLELLAAGRLVNGDRWQESLDVSFHWSRHAGRRWRTSGHLTWSDSEERLGPEFRRFDDPTHTVGSGDNDGARLLRWTSEGGLAPTGVAVDSRWSFQLDGAIELPWRLDLAASLSGREGYPSPWLRRVARPVAGIAAVQLTEDPASLRTGDVVTLDARLAKQLELGDLRLGVSLEAFNLLGADTVLRRELDLGVGRGGAVDEAVAPRVLRLGVRLAWR